MEIDCDRLIREGHSGDERYQFQLDIALIGNRRIKRGSTIEIEYPTNVMLPAEGVYSGYTVDNSELGTTTVTVVNRDLSRISLNFETAYPLKSMATFANRKYGVEISDVNIHSVDDVEFDVKRGVGIVEIANETIYGLETEDELSAVTDEDGIGVVATNY